LIVHTRRVESRYSSSGFDGVVGADCGTTRVGGEVLAIALVLANVAESVNAYVRSEESYHVTPWCYVGAERPKASLTGEWKSCETPKREEATPPT